MKRKQIVKGCRKDEPKKEPDVKKAMAQNDTDHRKAKSQKNKGLNYWAQPM